MIYIRERNSVFLLEITVHSFIDQTETLKSSSVSESESKSCKKIQNIASVHDISST